MGKMSVYHGSYARIEKPEIRKSKNSKDFGHGFYCTVIREQAERWAKRYEKSVLNIYTVKGMERLKILEFKEMTEEWLEFIVRCRNHEKHDYDIVIGAMANDQIYNFISDYIDGVITKEAFWALARFKYPTHQINFASEKALSCLNFTSAEVVENE